MSLRTLLMLLVLFAGQALFADKALAVDPLPFADAAQEQRFRELTAELRCVMCQNQSLADSSAGIAVDLRREIFELMQSGSSDDQIKTFLTERYGDFVLYNPPIKPSTWLLWFAPFAILLAGAVFIVVMLRRRGAQFAQASHPPVNDSREDW